jgi:hypothetical protein
MRSSRPSAKNATRSCMTSLPTLTFPQLASGNSVDSETVSAPTALSASSVQAPPKSFALSTENFKTHAEGCHETCKCIMQGLPSVVLGLPGILASCYVPVLLAATLNK